MWNIHAGVRFLWFFLVLGIESEKFRFKYLLKKSFLGPQKKIYKYTERCEKKNEANTQDLKNNRMSTICDIPHDPHDQTKPHYKKVDDDTTKNEIWIDPREESETRRYVHIIRL